MIKELTVLTKILTFYGVVALAFMFPWSVLNWYVLAYIPSVLVMGIMTYYYYFTMVYVHSLPTEQIDMYDRSMEQDEFCTVWMRSLIFLCTPLLVTGIIFYSNHPIHIFMYEYVPWVWGVLGLIALIIAYVEIYRFMIDTYSQVKRCPCPTNTPDSILVPSSSIGGKGGMYNSACSSALFGYNPTQLQSQALLQAAGMQQYEYVLDNIVSNKLT